MWGLETVMKNVESMDGLFFYFSSSRKYLMLFFVLCMQSKFAQEQTPVTLQKKEKGVERKRSIDMNWGTVL
jgi:hypothetical protein